MHLKSYLLAIGIFVLIISCQSKTDENPNVNLDPNVHKVIVEEVIQTKTYTYLRVEENDVEQWLAISKRQVEEGEILYHTGGLEMKDFESKELDKTFETVYFIQEITDKPILESKNETTGSPRGGRQIIQKEEISISPVKNGITIAGLFSNRDEYSVKEVIVKGKVVKYNSQIMGKNWVHLQDGTKDQNNFDLTITTSDVVKVGDVVTFKGKIVLNKDFGSGYFYEVLMEEAKLESN